MKENLLLSIAVGSTFMVKKAVCFMTMLIILVSHTLNSDCKFCADFLVFAVSWISYTSHYVFELL